MDRRGKVRLLAILLSLGILILSSNFSIAEDYPTKPVNILVGFAPGDSIDVSARAVASKAEQYLGQPLIVSNRSGGVGAVVAGIIAKAKPDGYNLGCITTVTFTRALQFDTVPYKLQDFVPIMHYGLAQTGIIVAKDSPWKTFRELVEYAKKNPGKIKYGTLGAWSLPHISMELVAMKEGIQWTHIPFQGGAPAITALLGGHVAVAGVGSQFVPFVKEGSARLLATQGEKRMKKFPDIPTFRELGYDFINDAAFLFAAPKGTPLPIVKRLDEAFRKAMDDPEFIRIMESLEVAIGYRNSEDTRLFLEEAYQVHEKRIKFLKIPKLEERK